MMMGRRIVAAAAVLAMMFSAQAFPKALSGWDGVMSGRKVPKIYIEKITNETGDNNVDAAGITDIVKDLFATRGTPPFNVVKDKSGADLIFEGAIVESLWMEKAPITDVYGVGALAVDIATKDGKNYARMQISYTVTDARSGETLLDQVTQVTIKQPDVPKDKSYGMVFRKVKKILVLDIFKRYKKVHDEPGILDDMS